MTDSASAASWSPSRVDTCTILSILWKISSDSYFDAESGTSGGPPPRQATASRGREASQYFAS